MPCKTDTFAAAAPFRRGFCRMARAMLVLPGVALLMSGCVLPIAPEFQDPPSPPNYAPYIVSAQPPIGEVKTSLMPGDVEFSVSVSDPNILDKLCVRWISDYPPYNENTKLMERIETPCLAAPENRKPLR